MFFSPYQLENFQEFIFFAIFDFKKLRDSAKILNGSRTKHFDQSVFL